MWATCLLGDKGSRLQLTQMGWAGWWNTTPETCSEECLKGIFWLLTCSFTYNPIFSLIIDYIRKGMKNRKPVLQRIHQFMMLPQKPTAGKNAIKTVWKSQPQPLSKNCFLQLFWQQWLPKALPLCSYTGSRVFQNHTIGPVLYSSKLISEFL